MAYLLLYFSLVFPLFLRQGRKGIEMKEFKFFGFLIKIFILISLIILASCNETVEKAKQNRNDKIDDKMELRLLSQSSDQTLSVSTQNSNDIAQEMQVDLGTLELGASPSIEVLEITLYVGSSAELLISSINTRSGIDVNVSANNISAGETATVTFTLNPTSLGIKTALVNVYQENIGNINIIAQGTVIEASTASDPGDDTTDPDDDTTDPDDDTIDDSSNPDMGSQCNDDENRHAGFESGKIYTYNDACVTLQNKADHYCLNGYCTKNDHITSEYVFAGMYSKSRNDTCITPNPKTGTCSCPEWYYDTQFLGMFDDIDKHVHACWSFTDYEGLWGTWPLYDFGGMFSKGPEGTNCRHANPFTGSCSCPSGFTESQLLMGPGVDLPLYYCYQNYTGDTATYRFAGFYGRYANNPITGYKHCPETYWGYMVYGSAPIQDHFLGDHAAFICSK